ncbi:MAG: pyridoxal phosphate-dependent aminotransferase [bacterium]
MAERVAISDRGRRTPASPIRKLVPLADEAKARGVKVYHLNIGQPDIETPREMIEAYRRFDAKVLSYGPSGGLYDYVAALAGYYTRVCDPGCRAEGAGRTGSSSSASGGFPAQGAGLGLAVEPRDILVTTGGSEALLFVFDAICDPGDEIIVPEPFYTNYAGFAAMSCVSLVPVTCRADNGFALPPAAEFEAKITPRTRAIMFSNPGNPTGVVLSPDELAMLRRLALERGLFLIADEVYREFIYDDTVRHKSVLALEGLADRAVMCDSVSKRYSACGARIGCIVSRNRDLMATVLRFGQARLCPPTVDQLAALAALATPPAYFDAVRAEYRARRDLLARELCAMPGVLCQLPRGAFYTVTRLPVDDSERFAAWLLRDFALDGETVMVAPAAGFYATPGLGRNEVRIAYVLRTEDLARAMVILRRALEVYPGRTSGD